VRHNIALFRNHKKKREKTKTKPKVHKEKNECNKVHNMAKKKFIVHSITQKKTTLFLFLYIKRKIVTNADTIINGTPG